MMCPRSLHPVSFWGQGFLLPGGVLGPLGWGGDRPAPGGHNVTAAVIPQPRR